MRMLGGVLIIVVLSSTAFAENILDNFSKEAKDHLQGAFDQLHLPGNANDEYKAKAGGMILATLDSCFLKSGDLNQVIAHDKCVPVSVCITNGFIMAFGDEFSAPQQSQAAVERGKIATSECIKKYI